MATSKSAKGKWTAGALLYSGRRDPLWAVPARLAKQLMAIWDAAESVAGRPPDAPGLGFRGVFLRDPGNREWRAFRGFITLAAGRGTESRRDPDRKFERAVLAAAPPGLLPPGVSSADLG